MRVGILPIPHPNARYQAATSKLLEAELLAFAQGTGSTITHIGWEMVGTLNLLTFEAAQLSPRDEQGLARLSGTLACFVLEPGGLLRPLSTGADWYFEQDLAAVPKYKGKTNEAFTRLLISLALYHSDFAGQWDTPLTVLDPLCGRGTTLFCALERGFHATGVETDKNDVSLMSQYFTRYLKYHRMKHTLGRSSLTVDGRAAGEMARWETAPTQEKYRDGDIRTLTVVKGDTTLSDRYFKKGFHLLVADLPYGVQHGGEGNPAAGKGSRALLSRALPAWKGALQKGGAMALSFNRHTLPHQEVVAAVEQAGLTPVTGMPWDDLSHFVEQAVLRDIVIARKQ